MLNIVYGAVGVIAVLLLLLTGAIIGWRLHVAYLKHNTRVVRQELTEEERQKFRADQAAWEAMMNYSTEAAYGMQRSLEEFAKKE